MANKAIPLSYLSKLKEQCDELYEKKGEGGTTVVANPSAAGTEDLLKLQVENTVYNIPATEIVFSTEAAADAVEVAGFSVEGQNFKFPSGGDSSGGGGGTKLYSHNLNIDNTNYFFISTSETPCNSLSALQASSFIMGAKALENPSPRTTKFVVSIFSSSMVYINVTGAFQGPTGADFAVIDLSSATISDTVTPL